VVFLLTANGGGDELGSAIDDTTANPHLDADTAIGGVSLSVGIVDVGTESVQGSATLFEVLATCDFSTADTAGDGDLDTLGTGTHGGGDGVLDGTTILDAAFNLFGDVLSNEDGVHLGALHLADVDLDILAGELLEFLAQFVDLGASTTDDETRTGGVDGDGEQFEGTLNINLGDASLGETGVEILTNLVVLNELLFKSSSAKPVRIPSADATSSVSNWVSFLSHC
jgi:hypothetical protein